MKDGKLVAYRTADYGSYAEAKANVAVYKIGIQGMDLDVTSILDAVEVASNALHAVGAAGALTFVFLKDGKLYTMPELYDYA